MVRVLENNGFCWSSRITHQHPSAVYQMDSSPVSQICALMRLPSGWVTTIVANSTPTVVFRSDRKLGTVPSALGRLSCHASDTLVTRLARRLVRGGNLHPHVGLQNSEERDTQPLAIGAPMHLHRSHETAGLKVPFTEKTVERKTNL